jgi:hypothetical protein
MLNIESSYLKIKIYDKQIENKEIIILNLFNFFPKEDIDFELDSDGLIIYLKELDFLKFKKQVEIEIKKNY